MFPVSQIRDLGITWDAASCMMPNMFLSPHHTAEFSPQLLLSSTVGTSIAE